VNLRVAVLWALFEYLTLERGYAVNPALRLVGKQELRRTPRFLTVTEVRRLVEHVAAEGGALVLRDLALVVVFWQTALQVAEVARLRLDQLDREAKLLRVTAGHGGYQDRRDRRYPGTRPLTSVVQVFAPRSRATTVLPCSGASRVVAPRTPRLALTRPALAELSY
jgi:integrase/recombinase XerC